MTTELRVETVEVPCCGIAEIKPETGEHLVHSAALFKALSDPTRLRILKAISLVSEACECNIVPSFGLSQPTISYLRCSAKRLIHSEQRGHQVYHTVNQRPAGCCT
jgi:hypothetical protein